MDTNRLPKQALQYKPKVATTCTGDGHKTDYQHKHYNINQSGYNMYIGWTHTYYHNQDYDINQKDKETLDDRGRDGGTNFILRIKEQETRLTHQEHDDDDYDDDIQIWPVAQFVNPRYLPIECFINLYESSNSVY